MDEWLPEDPDAMERYYEIVNQENWKDMKEFFIEYGNEDVLQSYGLKSRDMDKLAKAAMENYSPGLDEAAPKMAKNEEAAHIQELMNQIANAQKGGGSGRYGKEFDKAKTKALRALKDMVSYSKIGR